MRRKAISSRDESKAASLYEKYRIAQKTIDELCSGINTEVSDNDKRVMILQLIAAPSYEKIEQAKERISSGEDFEECCEKGEDPFPQIEYQVSSRNAKSNFGGNSYLT